jgi:hypothetical protein
VVAESSQPDNERAHGEPVVCPGDRAVGM